MTDFLGKYGGTLAVGAVLLAVVALIIVKFVKDRRAGKHCCGGDCSKCCNCPSNNVTRHIDR